MFCDRAIKLIDEDIELFIAERPAILKQVIASNPWYKKPRNIKQKKRINKEVIMALSKEMVKFSLRKAGQARLNPREDLDNANGRGLSSE